MLIAVRMVCVLFLSGVLRTDSKEKCELSGKHLFAGAFLDIYKCVEIHHVFHTESYVDFCILLTNYQFSGIIYII